MNKSSFQTLDQEGKNNQGYISPLKQSGLQFKFTKKRTLRRPLRSRSTVSSNSAKNSCISSTNYNTLDNFSIPDSNAEGCLKNITNMQMDFSKFNGDNQKLAPDYKERGVKRSNQQNILTKKANYNYKYLTCHTDRTSKNNQYQQQENTKNFCNTDRNISQKFNYRKFKTNTLLSRLRSNTPINEPLQSKYVHPPHFSQTASEGNFIRKSDLQFTNQIQEKVYNRQYASHMRNKSTNLPILEDHLSLQSQSIQKNCVNESKKYNFAKKKQLNQIMASNIYYNSNKQFNISQFQLGLSFSEDIYGKTYPARHKITGFALCIKEIIKKQVKHELKKFIQYLKIHSSCNSCFIVDIFGIIQQKDKIFLLMEYHKECELYLKIKSSRGISVRDSLSYIQNISQGVGYLHDKNIAYRNLKPQNISYFFDTCKLCNLSSSCLLAHQNSKYMGALQYCAPELLTGEIGLYQKQCDIWAIGILLYEMINGITPWYNLSHKKIVQKIISSKFDLDLLKMDHKIKKIFDKILIKNMKLRISPQKLSQQLSQIINQMEKHQS